MSQPSQAHDRLQAIGEQIARIIEIGEHFRGEALLVDIIANPKAGALARDEGADEVLDTLRAFSTGLIAPSRPRKAFSCRIFIPSSREELLQVASSCASYPHHGAHLIVSLGGDGTHSQVLAPAASAARDGLWYLRLPFGTGNDGADAPSILSAAALLLGEGNPYAASYLTVERAGGERAYCFNIVSFGLDAYVAEVTNRFKNRFSGDLYRFVADLMTLVYEPRFGIEPMRLRVHTAGGEVRRFERRFLVTAFGASGNRCYGDGKPVLPSYENCCLIDRIGTLARLPLKRALYAGTHGASEHVQLISVTRAVVEYPGALPMQIDGETCWLGPGDFPLQIQLHERAIRGLRY